ncbi:MAG: hypothetical protein IJ120_03260 [Solobacterium sp.]|nr:hypothetical protein [Solobacterium sp.]
MGLFHKRNPKINSRFRELFDNGVNETESEFLDSMNEVVRMVEYDTEYTTNDKLKIYELMSQLCNCSSSDRHKFARKLKRIL